MRKKWADTSSRTRTFVGFRSTRRFFVRCQLSQNLKTKVSRDDKDLKILLYSISRLNEIYFTRSSIRWSYPSMYPMIMAFLKKNKKLKCEIRSKYRDKWCIWTFSYGPQKQYLKRTFLKKRQHAFKNQKYLTLNSIHCNQRKIKINKFYYLQLIIMQTKCILALRSIIFSF